MQVWILVDTESKHIITVITDVADYKRLSNKLATELDKKGISKYKWKVFDSSSAEYDIEQLMYGPYGLVYNGN